MRGNYIWGNKKRINSYSDYIIKEFGGRVQKLALDAGFSCPNRDGTVGTGGCTFCDNNAFNPSYCKPEKSINLQIEEGIEFHSKRYRRSIAYFAYFQPYSNTYAPLGKLKSLYEEALSHPRISGLIIGTRPDCIDDALLDYLAQLSKKYFIVIEYGIESSNDETLKRINRGHDFASTINAIEKTNAGGIKTGGHIIIGLPGETREDILDSVKTISKLPLFSIKFHQLQIIRGTKMEEEYKNKPEEFLYFTLDDYLDFMTEILSILNPEFVIERIAGEVPPEYNISPAWGLRYDQTLVKFMDLMEKKDLWQGKYYSITK